MSGKNLPKILHNISKINSLAVDITEDTDLADVEVHLELLEDNWSEYKKYEVKLTDKGDETCEKIEDMYTQTKVLLRRAQRKLQEAQRIWPANVSIAEVYENQKSFMENITLLSKNASSDIKLPRINIPIFSGNYADFPSFRDLFESTVHNNKSLPDVHKFQYLKGLLRDEAAALVKHISITSANYNEAWVKIVERYDQKQAIINEFIQKFLEQPNATFKNPKSIRQLCDTSDEIIRGLKALGRAAESRDHWIIYILLTKLDSETRHIWNRENNNNPFPTIADFFKFLGNHCNTLEMSDIGFKKPSMNSKQTTVIKGYHATASTSDSIKPLSNRVCLACNDEAHQLYQCPMYIKMDINARNQFVTANNFCYNCLYSNHSVRNCPSLRRCMHCRKKHHTSLHTTQPESAEPQTSQSSECNSLTISPNSEPAQTYHASLYLADNTRSTQRFNSILPTAVIRITNKFGKQELCRALLDSGSQASMISESCMQRLQLPRHNYRVSVTGIASRASSRGITSITATSSYNQDNFIKIDVLVNIMDKINSMLPSSKIEISNYDYLKSLQLADPQFNQPREIDVLIGADHFINILEPGKIQGPKGSPSAQKTIFGWIVAGEHLCQSPNESLSFQLSIDNIDQSLRKFWEIEEVEKQPQNSPEEASCEEHFAATHARETSGRYTVKLPFRENPNCLGQSLQCAISRLHTVERKLYSNPSLREEYRKFMKEYISLGHMEEISHPITEVMPHFYLPHHSIIKESSSTTKVRVVFDGSCKSTTGVALNAILLVGPTIQPDLSSILLRFREHRIAFSADIEKMYRQVLVSSEDTQFQRIVWRDDPKETLKQYQLNTVTYGTSSASFLAIRTLQQLSIDEQNNYPDAAKTIRECFYVDDLLAGAETVKEAVELKQQLIDILQSGGFSLRKWSSNSPQLMDIEQAAVQHDRLSISEAQQPMEIKLLGLQWDASSDSFCFNVNVDSSEQVITKRKFLSEASKLFDPLGWLSPIIITIKIMFQKLWLIGLGWDEELPIQLSSKWTSLKTELKEVENLKINRFLFISSSNVVQFHGFCDASELAYSAAIYVRGTNDDGNIQTTLICAKTKVAPIKQVSLPRLELFGAKLLSTLMQKVVKIYNFKNYKIYTWTDSTIVLRWLSDVPRRWKTYIANRTSEIHQILPTANWKHVASGDNPADCATRGLASKDLLKFNLWWKGPTWLAEEESHWPNITKPSVPSNTDMEERQIEILTQHLIYEDSIAEYLSKFNFTKMVRILSFCFRFITNSKRSEQRITGSLKSNELQHSTIYYIKWAQRNSFPDEINALNKSRNLPTNSVLKSLVPFIDILGIIRVGGRLQNATCHYNAKHPIILSNSHIISEKIIEQFHLQYLHPGPTLLSHIIRQNYWIVRGRALIRNHVNKCLTCFRYKATASTQLMGNLPASRITPSRCFFKCGVDYLGPIEILSKKGRGAKCIKAYISVFVCMAFKAIHIEAVTDLTAESFIAALKRFISRRGLPSDIYSDNGTNFVGARRKINEVYQLCLSSSFNSTVTDFLAKQQINWHFILPGAANFGGLWESAVKSIKHHLLRITNNTKFTYEEMSTLLCEIEAILNSRPLCPKSEDDIENFDALTPGHFIIGAPLVSLPEKSMESSHSRLLPKWQNLQCRVQSFWKRYSLEYINNLQQRQKWNTTQQNLRLGDLVLLKEPNLPPTNWLLGRVLEVHPGTDDLVRVATIKTSKSILKRSLSKLVKLPID